MIEIMTAERTARDCIRVWFIGPKRGASCLFWIPACRNEAYLRFLIDFMKWKLSL